MQHAPPGLCVGAVEGLRASLTSAGVCGLVGALAAVADVGGWFRIWPMVAASCPLHPPYPNDPHNHRHRHPTTTTIMQQQEQAPPSSSSAAAGDGKPPAPPKPIKEGRGPWCVLFVGVVGSFFWSMTDRQDLCSYHFWALGLTTTPQQTDKVSRVPLKKTHSDPKRQHTMHGHAQVRAGGGGDGGGGDAAGAGAGGAECVFLCCVVLCCDGVWYEVGCGFVLFCGMGWGWGVGDVGVWGKEHSAIHAAIHSFIHSFLYTHTSRLAARLGGQRGRQLPAIPLRRAVWGQDGAWRVHWREGRNGWMDGWECIVLCV